MSDLIDTNNASGLVSPETVTAESDDAAYEAAFDRMTAGSDAEEFPEPGQTRGPDGKFAAAEKPAEQAGVEPEQQAEAVAKPVLPANMPAEMADVLDGMDAEKAGKLTAWADKLHRQMSDLGRQASAAKAFGEVVGGYPEYFQQEGAPTPPDAFNRMMAIQKQLDADPIGGLRMIAEAYGVTDKLFGGEGAVSGEAAELRQTISKLRAEIADMASPKAVRTQIDAAFQERTALDELGRFAQSKPHYKDVEAVLSSFIPMAREQAGEGAGYTAILEAAYDMAVNALPSTRAKLQAAAATAAATAVDPKRAEAAKKASSINVKGSPTGATRYASEDEAMAAAYDRVTSA